MKALHIAALLGLFGFFAAADVASAQTYRWCAVYGTQGGVAQNCGFNTFDQCRATISGAGGSCQENPLYKGGDEKPAAKKKKSG